MKLKVAITSPEEAHAPYIVDVAIPKITGGYWVFRYEKHRYGHAIGVLADYFEAFRKSPESIEEFHFQKVEVHQSVQELPFGKT